MTANAKPHPQEIPEFQNHAHRCGYFHIFELDPFTIQFSPGGASFGDTRPQTVRAEQSL
jgi:hypothetical protein